MNLSDSKLRVLKPMLAAFIPSAVSYAAGSGIGSRNTSERRDKKERESKKVKEEHPN
jgi:hypothetical protein